MTGQPRIELNRNESRRVDTGEDVMPAIGPSLVRYYPSIVVPARNGIGRLLKRRPIHHHTHTYYAIAITSFTRHSLSHTPDTRLTNIKRALSKYH